MKLCCQLSVLRLFHFGHALGSWRSVLSLSWREWFSCKGGEWKDLLLWVCVVNRTSNMNSLCSLADCVKKKCLQRWCRKCSTIISPHSTNHIIDLRRCRHSCRRRIFDSILLLAVYRTILTIATSLPDTLLRFSLVAGRSTCLVFQFWSHYCCGRENTVLHKN